MNTNNKPHNVYDKHPNLLKRLFILSYALYK